MQELRWNPLLGTYTMVAANRQQRPHLQKNTCPFCPGSAQIPDGYDVLAYPNDFPVLSQSPPTPKPTLSPYHSSPSHGACEVLLYDPNHTASMANFSIEKIKRILQLWQNRWLWFQQKPNVQYIFIFENKGEEVGVTMHHPHGQLYAYSFLPLKLQIELDNCRTYWQQHQRNLWDDMIQAESKEKERLVAVNEEFLAFIPYFNDYPYGVYIVARSPIHCLAQFEDIHFTQLAKLLQSITKAFDALFQRPFPFMMGVYQTPVNMPSYAEAAHYYRWHIAFYPPLRAADKIKWNASSETGAWATANPRSVEECAAQLRQLIQDMG